MKSWRLNWAFNQVSNLSAFKKHQRALSSPLQFWWAMGLKIIPGLSSRSIPFRLRNGGAFAVKEFMTLYIYKEIFIDGCYDQPALKTSSPTIIDVGANTGLFAIRMKQLYPQASLHCYEPMPANFKQLSENLDVSKVTNCVAYQEGVGGSTRNEKLYIHEKNLGGHSIYAGIAGSQSVDITLVDLKTALDRLHGVPCHLLKLDCEGAEYEIIKSIDQDRAKQIERIVFEPTAAAYDVQELIGSLTRLGYRVAWNEGLCIATREGVV